MRLILLALLASLIPLLASERPPPLVRIWQSEDGLPGNVVRSIVQAADGHLWIATAEGIARFDGIEFMPVEPDGELRRLRFAFSRLFALPDNSIWVATYQGALFQVRDGRLQSVIERNPAPNAPLVTQLIAESPGVFHALRGEEIWRIVDGQASPIPQPSPDLLTRFAKDFDQQITNGRAVLLETLPALTLDNGDRWSLNPSGRLTVTDPSGTSNPIDLPGLDPPYTCNELLEDREGNIWLATPVNGLVRVRNARVEVLSTGEGLLERQIFGLLQDSEDVWWIANRRGGIDLWTPTSVHHLELVPTGYHRPVACLFEDRDKRMWIASRGGSVFLYQNGNIEPQFSKSQVPSKVRAILQDPAGTLWFGGEQGLASFDGTLVRNYTIADGIAPCDVTTLTLAPDASIIVGTSDGRILIGKQQRFELLGDPSTLRHWWISGILARSNNEIWVTTLGGGLSLWNGKNWHRFTLDDGLPDLRLTTILDDGNGHFWFGSLGGILRASRTELLARSKSQNQPLHWLRLDRSDGLPTRECVGGYQPAGWKARDGKLWFPTGNGVVRIRPDLIGVNRVPPPVFLRSTRLNGQPHDDLTGPIHAGPGRSRIEFRFAGLSYSSPEKVTYRARLLGLDGDWRELGTQRVAAYEAVPPGRYEFEVVAVNGDGVWSAKPARMEIRIHPHFWESTWFIIGATLLTLLAAATVGSAIARNRLKRRINALKIRHAREAERSRIARDLHDDLGASLTEISILSALAAEGEDETVMRPALGQLSNKAKAVVGTLDEIVWAVNPGDDTLRSLIDYLAAFAREFLDTAAIPLRTDIPRSIPDLPLDSTVRHGIFLAAREALNNLVKHSGATEARLTVTLTPNHLEVRIQDNGRGFNQSAEASHTKGYGVGNLAERMRACGGSSTITSIPRQGVTVSLSLPLPSPT